MESWAEARGTGNESASGIPTRARAHWSDGHAAIRRGPAEQAVPPADARIRRDPCSEEEDEDRAAHRAPNAEHVERHSFEPGRSILRYPSAR
jgi:hypothetical protein